MKPTGRGGKPMESLKARVHHRSLSLEGMCVKRNQTSNRRSQRAWNKYEKPKRLMAGLEVGLQDLWRDMGKTQGRGY